MTAPNIRAVIDRPSRKLQSPLQDYYRCGESPAFGLSGELGESKGFFRFGQDLVCYGETVAETCATVNSDLVDVGGYAETADHYVMLPFDITEVVDNLRYELYTQSGGRWVEKSWVKDAYYRLRPLLPVSVRKHLQKVYLSGWDRILFPAFPVDRTVDLLFEKLLVLAMRALEVDRLPFIWFWPDGHSACAIMTHDVETEAGRDFIARLMGIDGEFGIKASFQIVPEKRYAVPDSYLETIRRRGFEINVQGLDHDGNLFRNREVFLDSAKKINQYARQYGARGFRSPILYRNSGWFRDLEFSYDMSVPNVACLEAQRGGCCTVMPYFLPGGMIELPVTAAEDYTLVNILNDHSTKLWKQQNAIILSGHGVMKFILHHDYVIASRGQNTYKALLEHLKQLESENNVWMPLPRDVDQWWRDRSEMTLAPAATGWRIEGPGSERARVAWAHVEEGNGLTYEI